MGLGTPQETTAELHPPFFHSLVGDVYLHSSETPWQQLWYRSQVS